MTIRELCEKYKNEVDTINIKINCVQSFVIDNRDIESCDVSFYDVEDRVLSAYLVGNFY